MISVRLALTAVCLALVSAGTAQGQSATLPAAGDVFVSAMNPSSNYGGNGALAVSAPGLPKGEFDSLLRFDFAPAKMGFDAQFGAGAWALQSVTLTLTPAPPANPLFNASGAGNVAFKWIANDSGVEGTGTPNAPTTDGLTFNGLAAVQGPGDEAIGVFAFNPAAPGTVSYGFTLTPFFAADAMAGNLVSFLALPGDAAVSAFADAREFKTASARPVINVVAVPEPATAALALCGWLVLAARRSRLRRG